MWVQLLRRDGNINFKAHYKGTKPTVVFCLFALIVTKQYPELKDDDLWCQNEGFIFLTYYEELNSVIQFLHTFS